MFLSYFMVVLHFSSGLGTNWFHSGNADLPLGRRCEEEEAPPRELIEVKSEYGRHERELSQSEKK